MTLAITGIYAAILGIMFVALRVNVIIERAKSGISIMHGDNMALAEKIRKFGNFIEVVPHALILLAITEAFGASSIWLHIIGGTLIASRILHPIGLDHTNGKNPIRIVSGMLTSISFVVAIVFILWSSFSG